MSDPLRYFKIDWDAKIKKRFPNGIVPTETPLMRLFAVPNYAEEQKKLVRVEGQKRIDAAVKGMVGK